MVIDLRRPEAKLKRFIRSMIAICASCSASLVNRPIELLTKHKPATDATAAAETIKIAQIAAAAFDREPRGGGRQMVLRMNETENLSSRRARRCN
jgi:hypothetical protein